MKKFAKILLALSLVLNANFFFLQDSQKAEAAGTGTVTVTYTGTITVDKTGPTAPNLTSTLPDSSWLPTNASIVVTLTPGTDNLTGIASTHYRINGGVVQNYTGPFTLTKADANASGIIDVQAYSVDGVGNQGTPVNKVFRIDSVVPTAPTINVTPATWTNTAATVTIAGSTDTQSGIAEYLYTMDGGPETKYTTPFMVTSEGSHTIVAWAVDNVGNKSVTNTNTASVDKTDPDAPVISVSHPSWTNTDVTFSITNGADALSGSASSQYRIDNGATQAYSGPQTITTSGEHTIKAATMDNAGNMSPEAQQKVYIDKEAPTEPTVVANPSTWTNQIPTVTITDQGTDALSGIDYVEVDTGLGYVAYDAPTLDAFLATLLEGETTLKFRSVDLAGNRSNEVSVTLQYDKTEPSKPSVTLSNTEWSKDDVTLDIAGSVDISPVSYEYRIDGGSWQQGTSGTISTDGGATIEARAIDAAGNISEIANAVAKVDKLAPVVDITTTPDNADWSSAKYSVTVDATDTLSGIAPAGVFYAVTQDTNSPATWLPYSGPVEIADEGIWYMHAKAIDVAGNVTEEASNEIRLQYVPDAPTNLVTTNIQEKEITLKWDLLSGRSFLDGYSYEVVNKTTGNQVTLPYPTDTYTDTGLTGGTTYEYEVILKNHVGEAKSSVTVETIPEAPANLHVEKIDRKADTAIVRWDTVKGATKYHIVIKDDTNTTVYDEMTSPTAFTMNNLVGGTLYNITVSSMNASGEGAQAATSFLSLPDAPGQFNAANIFVDKIILGWNASKSATKYHLDRDGNNVYSGNALTYEDTGLDAGTKYSYGLAAENATGEGASATLDNLITLPAQIAEIRVVKATTTSFDLDWDAVKGADSYIVTVDGGPEDLVTTTSVKIPTLVAGKQYTIQVTAQNASGRGAVKQVEIMTLPEAINASDLTITDIEQSSATINWVAVTGASKYKVVVNGVEYEVAGTSLPITGLEGSKQYTATVQAGNTSGYGAITSKNFLTKPNPPSNFKYSDPKANSVKLTWDADSTATSYTLFQDGIDVYTGTTNDHVATSLMGGTDYTFAVRVTNASGDSSLVTLPYTTPTDPIPSSSITATPDVKSIDFSWTPVHGAASYELLDKQGNVVYSGTSTSTQVTGLAGGTEYDFTFIAVNGTGLRSEPTTITVLTKPDKPTGTKVIDITNNSVTINVGTNTGQVDEYIIIRDGTEVGRTNDKFVDTNLNPATGYTYEIIPVNSSGNGESVTVKATTLTNPVDPDSIKVTPGITDVEITWDPVPGAVEYIIVDENGTEVWRGTNPSATIEDLAPGSEHDYEIIVINDKGAGSTPTPVHVVTKPQALDASAIQVVKTTDTTVELKFVLPVSGYEHAILIRDGEEIKTFDLGVSTYTDTGLKPSTKYKYELFIENEVARSETGGLVEATTTATPVIDTGGNSGGGGGGDSTPIPTPTPTPKPEPTPEPEPTPTPKPEPSNPFGDIDNAFNKDQILSLYNMGILKGVSTGNFEPNRAITRIEFVSLIVRALGLPEEPNTVLTWKDLKQDAWYIGELKTATKYGIAHGFSDTKFAPNAVIDRQQAAKMIANTLYGETPDSGKLAFIDSNTVAKWAYNEVKALTTNNIVKGYPDGTFRPISKLTRAESVALIYNMLEQAE